MFKFPKKLKRNDEVSLPNTDTAYKEKLQGRKPNSNEASTLDKTEDLNHAGVAFNATEEIDVSIFLVPEGIQNKRYQLIEKFASKSGFRCNKNISEGISHVVSDLKDIDQLCRLYPELLGNFDEKIVSIQWLHTCARQKSLVPEESFLIPGYHQWIASRKKKAQLLTSQLQPQHFSSNAEGGRKVETKFTKDHFNENVLERNAPLKHYNHKLVEPLLFLNEYWTVMGDERRALAYAKSATTIKCLPFTVTATNEVDDLKGLGTGHSLKVIQETLETGTCQEVSVKKDSEKFQILKNLSSVYGIGPSLALRLHNNHDVKSVQDLVMQWKQLALADERIKVGVAYHTDLSAPVSRDLANKILEIVKLELSSIKEGYHVELAGGFRRGKMTGHDVDLLISSKNDGAEVSPLPKLLKQLNQKGYILQWRMEKSSYDEEAIFRKKSDEVSTMDHFEKCFCVFKCPLQSDWVPDDDPRVSKLDFDELVATSRMERSWKAIRVDLVVVPKSQWAYALLGWTGSKLFMRMLRHYSNTILHRSLNSHGLWDRSESKLLAAASEEDVFRHLGLSYKDPFNRNF